MFVIITCYLICYLIKYVFDKVTNDMSFFKEINIVFREIINNLCIHRHLTRTDAEIAKVTLVGIINITVRETVIIFSSIVSEKWYFR